MCLTLKKARLLADKTQDEVAAMLGVHVQTYRKFEENPDEVTIADAKKIAAFLGIPYDAIFFGAEFYLK